MRGEVSAADQTVQEGSSSERSTMRSRSTIRRQAVSGTAATPVLVWQRYPTEVLREVLLVVVPWTRTSEASPLTAESGAGVGALVLGSLGYGDDDGQRVARRSCRVGHRVPGPGLPQRVCAESAGRRPGGLVHDRASGLPDSLPGDHGEDRDRVPPRGPGLRRGVPDPGGEVRQGRPQARGDAPLPVAAGRDRLSGGGRDRGRPGVPERV